MATLKGRLQRLRELGLTPASALSGQPQGSSAGKPAIAPAHPSPSARTGPARFLEDWDEVAPHVWMRSQEFPLAAPARVDPAGWASSPAPLAAAPFAAAPFAGEAIPTSPTAFTFFDFETTGLSGGAGTIPFLAAAGAFLEGGGFLSTQLFIDDYPGEPGFLRLLLALLETRPAVVTYNGKAFDMPLLRTRCIMNGIALAEPLHIDALHAARRLWKRRTASCSLKNLEAEILGIDRGEDVPGAAIPALWLDFAAGRGEGAMRLVCSHNASDIVSLARLFLRIDAIHAAPLSSARMERVDAPRLALWLWRKGRAAEALELLECPAADGDREAGMLLYRMLRRSGRTGEAVAVALRLPDAPGTCIMKAKACEHLLGDPAAALDWAARAGALAGDAPDGAFAEALEKRKERLRRKLDRRPGAGYRRAGRRRP